MKKIFYSIAVLAIAFFAGSCQKENFEPAAASTTVTYTVTVPDVATKALGDDVTAVNELVYEVYRTAGEKVEAFTDADNLLYHRTAEIKNGVATLPLEFVNDQNFTVLFWAQTANNGVYDASDLTDVKVESPDAANNVNAAVFTGRDFVIDCVSATDGNVILSRPVAQLNIATTPASLGAFDDTVVLEGSSVKVTGLSTSFNVATLAAGELSDVAYEFTETAVPDDVLKVNGEDYTYVAMNYVGFIPAAGTNVTVEYVINTNEGNIDNTVANVPVKQNFRTNIVGNLITGTSDYTVTLDAEWGTPAEEVEVWDGKFLSQPAFDAATKTWSVKKASELAWLAAAVNGEVAVTRAVAEEPFKNETFVLTADIDLGNYPWTPIGLTGDKAGFQGTFDGQGHTISNLYVDLTAERKYQSAGLFGSVTGTLKNFTVKNATVKNLDAIEDTSNGTAVVVGASQYGSTIENVHVVNAVVSANKRAAGIAGYFCGTITGCTVDGLVATATPDKQANGTYENGDKLGGIVAYDNTPGTLIDKCSVKNAHIEGYRDLGGISGAARLSITNCTVENVDIVHNPLNGYNDSVTTLGAIHSGRVTPSGDVTTGNQTINVNIYAPDNVTIVKPGESLQAVVDAASAPAVIFLAEGTHTVGNLAIASTKDITLYPLKDAEVTIDGSLKVSGNLYAEGLTFTNMNVADWGTSAFNGNCVNLTNEGYAEIVDCTFNMDPNNNNATAVKDW